MNTVSASSALPTALRRVRGQGHGLGVWLAFGLVLAFLVVFLLIPIGLVIYTAFVTDVFSRKIVGWSTRSTMRTEDLPLEALEHALIAAKDQALQGLVHHSDRGSQYVSIRYSERLEEAGITPSVGSRGDAYDNALAETVNGLYKAELIFARPAWPSVTEVEFETLKWVHWWNHNRLHEALDYLTPTEYETNHYNTHPRAKALA